MTPKLLPTTLILGCTALLAFAFVLPSNTPQSAATAYAQSTPNVSFTQEQVQGKEGSTIYLKVKLDTPVTKTTKVTIKLTPDEGTTSRDIPGLTGTKTVTFYKNGSTSKTVAIRTSRTTAEGDKSLTASITKVGNVTVQGDTARVLVKDQRSSAPLAGNQNNTATTTPPTDCKQYEGVIPGETRKLAVETRSVNSYVYKPTAQYGSISPEGLRDLQLMYGDIGYWIDIGQVPNGGWTRQRFAAGTVKAFKFKTTEYNYAPYYQINTSSNPETRVGVIGMSVSECPGDFTSPAVLAQSSSLDVENRFGDKKGRDCVSYGSQVGSSIVFGVFSTSDGGGCKLQPNKTYYINMTTGFFKEESGSKYPYITDEDHDEGAGPSSDMVVDVSMRPFGAAAAARQIYGDVPNAKAEMIKNRSAAYSEFARFWTMFEDFRRAGEVRRQACLAAIPASDTTNVTGQTSPARLNCLNLSYPPLLPFFLP